MRRRARSKNCEGSASGCRTWLRARRGSTRCGVWGRRGSRGIPVNDGQLALGVFTGGAATDKPAYFILLEHAAGKVTYIRDFRYVPYIAAEAEIEFC